MISFVYLLHFVCFSPNKQQPLPVLQQSPASVFSSYSFLFQSQNAENNLPFELTILWAAKGSCSWCPASPPKGNTLFLPALGLLSHTGGSRTVLKPVELQRCDLEAHERHSLLLCCLCCHNSHSPSTKYVLQLFWELHYTESLSPWTQPKPVQFSLC